MDSLTETLMGTYPYDVFTDSEVTRLVAGTVYSRYGLIKRALSKGDLVQFRRGLYGLAQKYRRRPINLFELAQRIYYPSYVSVESALAFHGLIPEAVYPVTSISLRRSKTFDTPVGLFSFVSIPGYHLNGVERRVENGAVYFMATPEKAILDYIQIYKKEWTNLEPLADSLRIDETNLRELSRPLMRELAAGRSQRVMRFVRGVMKERAA